MTRNEILNMPAGRGMDALIHDRVMDYPELCKHESDGHGKCKHCGTNHAYFDSAPPLHYSTSIAAAWEVVEKMIKINYGFTCDWVLDHYLCTFTKCLINGNQMWANGSLTAPLAICHTALLAMMEVK